MTKQPKTSWRLPILIFIVACVGIFWLHNGRISASSGSEALMKPSGSEQLASGDDPCGFQKGTKAIDNSPTLSAAFKQRTDREINGYPTEISLEEGLRIFNAEEKCVEFRGTLPPLTEAEVIAAIVAGPTYGIGKVWQIQKKALWDIVIRKKLPRGSLLTAENGGCVFDSRLGKGQVCVKGQRIYLFLDLDQPRRASNPLKPEQIVVMRANYFGIESSNASEQ